MTLISLNPKPSGDCYDKGELYDLKPKTVNPKTLAGSPEQPMSLGFPD